jgi:hypothetical protein
MASRLGLTSGDPAVWATRAPAEPAHAGPWSSPARTRSSQASAVTLALTTDLVPGHSNASDPRTGEWRRVEVLDRPRLGSLRVLPRLLAAARSVDAIVLDGSVGLRGGYFDELMAVVLRARPRTAVILSDATWKRGTWWLDRLACRAGIRLMDRAALHYCVLSEEEQRAFPSAWGVDPQRVHTTLWPHTLTEAEVAEPVAEDGGVFAGGDSLRDYGPLLRVAGDLPLRITIATRRRMSRRRSPWMPSLLPANVQIGPLAAPEYLRAMRRASVVVVPLAASSERSAGQTTYVNAMAMGKLVIVTDAVGARDYVEHGKTGLLVAPGDPDALFQALRWAIDPVNRPQAHRIAQEARRLALDRLSPKAYIERLLRIARRAADDRRTP